ncbi:hotdog family protein [Psychromonas sp.]|uniref:hotdog family protein n=1 Tax=Psychromonas sp. TaxID=1884585 RepID=UPI003563ACF3
MNNCVITNNYSDISELLPHKAPMILIDKLVDVDELSVHCQVKIDDSGLFFNKQMSAVPAWVGIEFMAQTVAAWSGYHANTQGETPPIGFLLGSRRYNAECSEFTLGSVLDIYAEQLMENEGMAAFACRIECNEQVLARSQLNVFVPSPEKLKSMLGEKPEKEQQ